MNKDIQFDATICGNLNTAVEKEWLETNGLGGYASSTLSGANTSRYHGLLVAPTHECVRRFVFLSKLEEQIICGDTSWYLSCNMYPNTVHPTGFMYLKQFRLEPFPTFVYEFNEMVIEKKLFMVYGEHTVIIIYRLVEGPHECVLNIRPLIACRFFHDIACGRTDTPAAYNVHDTLIECQMYSHVPPLFLKHNGSLIKNTGVWYRNFLYHKELEQGAEGREDLYNPCEITYLLNEGRHGYLIATLMPRDCNVERIEEDERERRSRLVDFALRPPQRGRKRTVSESAYSYLLQAADNCLVKRTDTIDTIIAGYPYGSEWGRDSMVALTGLTLVPGKFDVAQNILRKYARAMHNGLLPNFFREDTNLPVYTLIDVSLWFFYAIYKYIQYTNDVYFVVHELYDSMCAIVRTFARGENSWVHMDTDSLLYSTHDMRRRSVEEASIDVFLITTQQGKSVIRNALWFHALKLSEYISEQAQRTEDQAEWREMATGVQANFAHVFWNADKNCLYDVVNGDYNDDSIRPHQIMAVSLPFTLLSDLQERAVVDIVERELFTMYGLRSLSPQEKQFIGRSRGDWYNRKAAYCHGAVWPWLMGPFIDAYIKVNGRRDNPQGICDAFLRAFFQHVLNDGGLGYISELFDGTFPHPARGCIAQAWNVAEVLRVYYEYVLTEHIQSVLNASS